MSGKTPVSRNQSQKKPNQGLSTSLPAALVLPLEFSDELTPVLNATPCAGAATINPVCPPAPAPAPRNGDPDPKSKFNISCTATFGTGSLLWLPSGLAMMSEILGSSFPAPPPIIGPNFGDGAALAGWECVYSCVRLERFARELSEELLVPPLAIPDAPPTAPQR
ncbi:hypothetical protein KEM55_005206 [Ascosphaera atra]|nr:hypothetical protein KEM55_005206 [Ascosphaera atra]